MGKTVKGGRAKTQQRWQPLKKGAGSSGAIEQLPGFGSRSSEGPRKRASGTHSLVRDSSGTQKEGWVSRVRTMIAEGMGGRVEQQSGQLITMPKRVAGHLSNQFRTVSSGRTRPV